MYPRIHSEVSYQRGVVDGGAKRDRTADLLRARQALSQLSYSPIEFCKTRAYQENSFRFKACRYEAYSSMRAIGTTRKLEEFGRPEWT
jgi:hypothetical protein